MAEVEIRDPTIKLFGKTIPLSLNHFASPNHPSPTSVQDHDAASASKLVVCPEFTVSKDDDPGERGESHKETSGEELPSDKQGDGSTNQITTDQSTSGISENPSVERETSSPKSSKNEEQSETSNSPDKTPKKPDKILPCPRCNSMDTKFCYYNNYNVNQPRHFCKNCQRYWTAGGSMRNVPVGAGRRKNKNSSSSHFRHLMVHENGVLSHHYMGNNGTFLTFGSDDSVPSASQTCQPNGFHINAENGDDHSSKSSITASNSSEKGGQTSLQQPVVKNFMPFPPQLPSFPGLPWPYSCSPPMGPPAVCPPGFSVSYYPPPPYWSCTVPPSWSLPSTNNRSTQNPFTSSSVLGKHSRDEMINPDVSRNEELFKQKNSETETCIPKTMKRVDDPNEASKSSIWCKVGIQTEKTKTSNGGGGGLFAGFQTKGKEDNHIESWSLLQANPAAFSRALQFRETA